MDHFIYVYDSSGIQKTIIGSKGTGPIQFNYPTGIAISGDIMYVAEYGGNKIHKLTLRGEFLSTFGSKGSGKGQFVNPWGICIGRNGRIYVADSSNHRIQVFHCDDTFSHCINCNVPVVGQFTSPKGLSFDVYGHLHVTSVSDIVTIFTPEGQYIRQYGQSYLSKPFCIAIDSAGNSLVTSYARNSLSFFDLHGNFIHSIVGFNMPVGIAIGFNGSVWVADTHSNRLVKYTTDN